MLVGRGTSRIPLLRCRPEAKAQADVRFDAHNGLKSDIVPCLKSAQ
jgi:hypothetical protein